MTIRTAVEDDGTNPWFDPYRLPEATAEIRQQPFGMQLQTCIPGSSLQESPAVPTVMDNSGGNRMVAAFNPGLGSLTTPE